mgnify:CR=1 FL=1
MATPRIRFTEAEFLRRQQLVRRAMAERGLDLLIVSDPSNMCWLTGFDAWSFYVHQCLVVSADEILWIGRGIDANSASLTTYLPEKAIHPYPDYFVQSTTCHPMEFVGDRIRSLTGSNIGVEMDNYYFSAKAHQTLIQVLPNHNLHDATALVNWQRGVKSEAEIETMRKAASVVEAVYEHINAVLVPNMHQNDLVAEILAAGARGADGVFGDYPAIVPLIGYGPESAACHSTWDDKPLAPGAGFFAELAGCHARYHCPISRTVYIGKPPSQYRTCEALIADCIAQVADAMRPGAVLEDVAQVFYSALAQAGFEKDNRCGYSTGLSYPPDWGERTMSLRPGDRTVLQENMVLHFMPGLWFNDWGFEMSETIRVDANGGECLAKVPQTLITIDG